MNIEQLIGDEERTQLATELREDQGRRRGWWNGVVSYLNPIVPMFDRSSRILSSPSEMVLFSGQSIQRTALLTTETSTENTKSSWLENERFSWLSTLASYCPLPSFPSVAGELSQSGFLSVQWRPRLHALLGWGLEQSTGSIPVRSVCSGNSYCGSNSGWPDSSATGPRWPLTPPSCSKKL